MLLNKQNDKTGKSNVVKRTHCTEISEKINCFSSLKQLLYP